MYTLGDQYNEINFDSADHTEPEFAIFYVQLIILHVQRQTDHWALTI